MRFRVQVPVWVSAEVREVMVNGTKTLVCGPPVFEAGTMYETFDTPIVSNAPVYEKAIEALVSEAQTAFADLARLP